MPQQETILTRHNIYCLSQGNYRGDFDVECGYDTKWCDLKGHRGSYKLMLELSLTNNWSSEVGKESNFAESEAVTHGELSLTMSPVDSETFSFGGGGELIGPLRSRKLCNVATSGERHFIERQENWNNMHHLDAR